VNRHFQSPLRYQFRQERFREKLEKVKIKT